MSKKPLLTDEMLDIIVKILKRGDTVELKKENGDIVVVEIKRQKKIKKPFTTG